MGAAEGANPGQRHPRSNDRDAAVVGRRPGIWILRAQDALWNDLWRIGGGDRIANLDGVVHGNYFPGRCVECRTRGKPQGRASYRVTNTVRVECYSGYKGDERPTKLEIGEQMLDVAEVEDRWYSPGATYFRVLLANGERYVLRREDAQDVWTLEAFRSPR